MSEEPDTGHSELRATEGLRLLHAEIRRLAAQLARNQAPGAVEPTSLVNDLYLRFAKRGKFIWSSREHFIAAASNEMRRILVDRARKQRAAKRGGAWMRVTLHPELMEAQQTEVDLLVLDEALHELADLEPRQHRIVEMRFFGGLTVEEVATVLGVTDRTVKGDWKMARAWLQRRLRDEGGDDERPGALPAGP